MTKQVFMLIAILAAGVLGSANFADSAPVFGSVVQGFIGRYVTIISAASSVAATPTYSSSTLNKGFVATITGTSATATVLAEISPDGTNWATVCTFNLSNSVPSDSCNVVGPYPFIRGEITAASGPAAVTLTESE